MVGAPKLCGGGRLIYPSLVALADQLGLAVCFSVFRRNPREKVTQSPLGIGVASLRLRISGTDHSLLFEVFSTAAVCSRPLLSFRLAACGRPSMRLFFSKNNKKKLRLLTRTCNMIGVVSEIVSALAPCSLTVALPSDRVRSCWWSVRQGLRAPWLQVIPGYGCSSPVCVRVSLGGLSCTLSHASHLSLLPPDSGGKNRPPLF